MMNRRPSFNTAIVLVSVLFVQTGASQDPTRFSLPEGAKARIGKGKITGNIAYSPDGDLLAVAGGIGIWIYDALTGAEIALLTGHTDPVNSVAFSPDGKTLVSGSGDQTVRLWNVDTGDLKATLEGYTGPVNFRGVFQMGRPWPAQVTT